MGFSLHVPAEDATGITGWARLPPVNNAQIPAISKALNCIRFSSPHNFLAIIGVSE
jgi:hypothetical protein